jgi:predicted anti-sigma-YlaC factor YlaD
MKCNELKGIIGALAGGELTDARKRREAEAHIRECAGCRAEFAAQAHVRRLLAAHPREEASPFMATRVMAEVRQLKRRFSPVKLRWAYSGAAALVLVAVMLVGGMMHPSRSPGIYTPLPEKAASQYYVPTMSGDLTPASFGEFVQQQHEDASGLLRAGGDMPQLEDTVRQITDKEGIYKELPKEKEGSAK